MSFNDGKVASTNYDEIRTECMTKCNDNKYKNKNACYSSCVSNYDHDKCVHYRTSRGFPMHSGNMMYCLDFMFFSPSAKKFGDMPKFE